MTSWSQGNPFAQDGLPEPTVLTPEASKRRLARQRIDSQAKGKRAERDLANWWKIHGFPDAHRAVVTGDRDTPDGGDLVLVNGDFRLVIEVKHHAGGLTDGQVAEYGAKLLRQVAQSKGTMGILVERRDRVADPGCWWVHVDPWHFVQLVCPRIEDFGGGLHDFHGSGWQTLACRTTVGYFAARLRDAGLAQVTP